MNDLPAEVLRDLRNICNTKSVDAVAIFGSAGQRPFTEIADIDLAIFVSRHCAREATASLKTLRLHYPTRISSLNGRYVKAERTTQDKEYHIILLDTDQPNSAFMARNANELRTITFGIS